MIDLICMGEPMLELNQQPSDGMPMYLVGAWGRYEQRGDRRSAARRAGGVSERGGAGFRRG